MNRLALVLAFYQAGHVYGLPKPQIHKENLDLLDRAVAIPTAPSIVTSYTSTPSGIQSASQTLSPSLTGSIPTTLPTGHATDNPVNSPSISAGSSSLAPIDSTLVPGGTDAPANAANVFAPMATNAPPQQITTRNDHPVKRLGILDQNVPIETNKFYANFFLGNQTSTIWTHPFSLTWAKGNGKSWGIAATHIEQSQMAWGQGNPPEYFIGPIGLQHIVFSADELGSSTVLTTDTLTAFSAYANLAPSANVDPLISFPLVQGMGFVTALYDKATPKLTSGTFFRTLKYVEQINNTTSKYRIQLGDNSNWLLYATPGNGVGAVPFTLGDSTTIQGPKNFAGVIQVTKNPANETGEKVFDASAGAYATDATISGSVDGKSGSYTLSWGKKGVLKQKLLMFALPHHTDSFDSTTKAALTNVKLTTTTKGMAQAVAADKITMVESNLPVTVGFAPWSPVNGGIEHNILAGAAKTAVNAAGAVELAQDMVTQTRLDSMYYSGKGLAKFAGIVFTIQNMAQNSQLAAAGLVKLKDAFNVFTNNTQPYPLVYDSAWKGVVSSATYQKGDSGLDFGNTYYNDHHFHYGYFVYAASVIAYLDPNWLKQGSNKAWVDMLVRDYSNPSDKDPYFPFTRSFDWYHGHSWAKGLFDSGDGKDEESSSEDTFATYALKMWGKVTGDTAMEARGNLQLAVQARSLQNYFLYTSDNKVEPAKFIPNKVSGIMFENKIHHTTYFGANSEYIQGIHMIPLNPSSAYTRSAAFVKEEWNTYFSNGRADKVKGGWKGILYANLALVDPKSSYAFFSSPTFDSGSLDGGASKTWYLAMAAALGGADGATASTNGTA